MAAAPFPSHRSIAAVVVLVQLIRAHIGTRVSSRDGGKAQSLASLESLI